MEQLAQLLQLVQSGQQEISQEVKESTQKGKVAAYATPASGLILAVAVYLAFTAQSKQIEKLAGGVETLSKSVSALQMADNNLSVKIREAIANAPYPWPKDKPEFDRRLREAERKIDKLELIIQNLKGSQTDSKGFPPTSLYP
jgi:hypothetical protein